MHVSELENITDTHTGTNYMAFLEKIPKHANTEGFNYEGHHVTDSEAMRRETKSAFDKFMELVIGNIEERLGCLGLIGDFIFMLPSNLPEMNSPDFGVYGDDEITKVCAHFKDHASLGNGTSVSAEWKLFKRILAVRCRGMTLNETVKFLHDINSVSSYGVIV